MPFLAAIPAIIPALISAAATVATDVYSITSAPSGAQPATVQQPTANPALSAQQKAIAGQTTSNVNSDTSGFVTPDYLSSFLQGNYGYSGGLQSVVNNAFGLGGGGSPGGGTGGAPGAPGQQSPAPSLAASILPYLTGGGPSQGGGGGAVDSLIQQNFQGFAV